MNTFKTGDRVQFAIVESPKFIGTVIGELRRDVSRVRWDDGETSLASAAALMYFTP